MGGKSKSQTVGFWYLPAYHAGLGIGPIDAFLQFRGGDKPAWSGVLTASGTISINAPNLWGGEKDQGGIVGSVDVMFGEAEQQPNAYLASVFGPQQPAWRGLATLVFKGGKYGAMNPYPQKASYKIRKIKQGWDAGACWYPETAEIPMGEQGWIVSEIVIADTALDATQLSTTNPLGVSFSASPADVFRIVKVEGMAFKAWSAWPTDDATVPPPPVPGHTWMNRFLVNGTSYWNGWYQTEEDAYQDVLGDSVLITGQSEYTISITDPAPDDDRGGLSVRVEKVAPRGVVAMNPAHILYYSRTSSDMGRESSASIDEASFTAAADWYFSQGFGLCTSYDPSAESVEEFEQRICRVAGCSLTRSLVDGKWYIDIANGEYDLESLPILTDDDILDFQEQPTLLDSAVNSVSVKYFDPEKKEAIVTPPVQAPALISDFGTNHLTIEYLEIPDAALAARVAQRELLARITPLRGFPLKTTRKPYAWRPSTYFRLQVPKRGIADMVCIFSEKSSGQLRSGAMTISATQDVYSVPISSFVEVEGGVDTTPDQVPVPIARQRAFEAPYIDVVASLSNADFAALDDDAGFLMVVADDPATSRNYTAFTGPVGGPYEQAMDGEWCPTAVVAAGADKTATAFTLEAGRRLSQVEVGSAALWDDEILRVDAINPSTGAVVFGRGCADTVPEDHLAGSRIWFYGVGAAADITEYTAGETIGVKLLTNTGSQQLPVASAAPMNVQFFQRIRLPYPPANVKVDSSDWPEALNGAFPVTWAHRNFSAQADQLIDTTAPSVTPADNTRYGLRFFGWDEEENLLLVERTDIGPGAATVNLAYEGLVRMELWTISDAGASQQVHVHYFDYTPDDPEPAESTITADAYTPVYGGTIIDGGDLDG